MRGPRPSFAVRHAALYALVVCVIALCACDGPARDESGALEIVIPAEVATLDPRFATRSFDIKVTRLVHAGLFGLEPDTLEPVPLLAESFEFNGERELTVKLRAGLRFHSGRPLSAGDVCATIRALSDPALGSPHRAVVRAIGRCEPTGRDTLTIGLSEPRATLLTDLEVPILRADQAASPPSARGGLDGLGPYRVGASTPSAIELSPVGAFVSQRVRHPVVVRTVRDENARALRLLAGKADIAPNAISPALLPALAGEPALSITSRPGANVTYLLVHNERAPLSDVALRRAISVAIDRETLVKSLLAGRAQPAASLLPPGHWSAPAVDPIRHDAGAARAVFEALAGSRELTLLCSPDRARVVLARAIAQMLGDAGLRVRVVALDFGVMLARLDAGEYEMAVLQMPELTEPNVLKWFFHPGAVPGEGGEGRNRARYRSAEIGGLLDAASELADRARRRPLYHSISALLARDLPVIPLWHEDQVAVVSRRAVDFRLSAEGRWSSVASLR